MKGESLQALAKNTESFADIKFLWKRLRVERDEGRFLEWKAFPPVGPSVGGDEKYRMVKVAISFANTSGGFILFGVSRTGGYTGLHPSETSHVDSSKIESLLNEAVDPSISYKLTQYIFRSKVFYILHVPPSRRAPHITTKARHGDKSRGSKEILRKYALYVRRGSQSVIAGPRDYQRIIDQHVERVRAEMLRRIKQVAVSDISPVRDGAPSAPSSVVEARLSSDSSATPFRFVQNVEDADVRLVHSDVSSIIFQSPDNILKVNASLAGNRQDFVL